jgi:hypothetical protein
LPRNFRSGIVFLVHGNPFFFFHRDCFSSYFSFQKTDTTPHKNEENFFDVNSLIPQNKNSQPREYPMAGCNRSKLTARRSNRSVTSKRAETGDFLKNDHGLEKCTRGGMS